jgi:hypothetical protein
MTLHQISDRQGRGAATGALDVRGWTVHTAADRAEVGSVRDVLVDDAGQPHYLDVDLGLFRKRVLVPIERVSTDDADECVWVAGFTRDSFQEIPAYDGDVARLNADQRAGLLDDYARAERAPGAGAAAGGGTREGLVRLGELDDFEVAAEDPDVRGWKVVASGQESIGKVEELVVDTAARRVAYLDVELDDEHRRSDDESRVLVPIERARLRPDENEVRLDGFALSRLADIPRHGGRYDRAYEATVLTAFDRDPNAPPPGERRR